MKGIDGTIASARPGGAPWAGSDETSSWPDEAGAQANNDATAPDASDLADLLQRHGEVLAAEQQSFNDRLSNLLNTRRELPANDRRRLNALLAELLDHSDELAGRDNAVAGEHQDVDQGQPVDLDAAGPAAEEATEHASVPEQAPAPEHMPANLIVSFDQAVNGIVKSVNEDFAANENASITPGQDVGGQSSG